METVKSGLLWEVGWDLGSVGMAGEGDCAFHYKTFCTLQLFLTNGILFG